MYVQVNSCICKYLTSLKQYIDLTGAVCVRISNKYLQILTPCWGHRMHAYACICTYFCQSFWRKYVHIHKVMALSRLLCVQCRSPAPAPVSALLPRGCYSKFVVRQQAQADRQIQSDQVCATNQRMSKPEFPGENQKLSSRSTALFRRSTMLYNYIPSAPN